MMIFDLFNKFKKTIKKSEKTDPWCLKLEKFHFIGADGVYYPCCYTRTAQGRLQLKQLLGENFSDLDLNSHGRSTIFQSQGWKILLTSFQSNPLPVCIENCPSVREKNNATAFNDFDGINHRKKIPFKHIPQPTNQ